MIIKGRESVLQRVVFELKYRYGYTYLDVCGRTVNLIQKDYPEWILRGNDPNPQNAPLLSMKNGCIFNFSVLKHDLSLEKPIGEGPLPQEDLDDFINQVELLSAIVIDQLGLKVFSRVGFRAWYIFPCDSEQESEKWLLDLGIYKISENVSTEFGGQILSAGIAIIILGEDRKFRIAFNGVERQAQIDFGQGILNIPSRSLHAGQKDFLKQQVAIKRRMRQNPEFAAMIDVDCFIDDPKIINPAQFIHTSIAQYTKALESILKR